MIGVTTFIAITDPNEFHKKFVDAIEQMQADGFNVEVQYQLGRDECNRIVYTALFIGRKKGGAKC